MNAESKASWKRLNASAGSDRSKSEIAYFFNALDQEYKTYLINKNNNTMNNANVKIQENRLKELKRAFESGLINKTEYETKRKEIINEF